MEQKELEAQKQMIVQYITDLLNRNSFTFEFQVKKNPKGVKVIYEVTQEYLDAVMKEAAKKEKES